MLPNLCRIYRSFSFFWQFHTLWSIHLHRLPSPQQSSHARLITTIIPVRSIPWNWIWCSRRELLTQEGRDQGKNRRKWKYEPNLIGRLHYHPPPPHLRPNFAEIIESPPGHPFQHFRLKDTSREDPATDPHRTHTAAKVNNRVCVPCGFCPSEPVSGIPTSVLVKFIMQTRQLVNLI